MTKNQMEERYKCRISKDFGFDDKRKYWVAIGERFEYADGWTLSELENNIKKRLGGN